MDEGLVASLLVQDATEAAQHRVHPETPLSEVLDLMVRGDVGAVPVVGESMEVLGIITSGDALDQILRDSPAEGPETRSDPVTARDVMTRTVLCVSQSEPLLEAAQTMVKRNVEQLPVVREGQLIGLVTRDAILRALHLGITGRPES